MGWCSLRIYSQCAWEDVRDSLYEATIRNPRERPPDYGQWIN